MGIYDVPQTNGQYIYGLLPSDRATGGHWYWVYGDQDTGPDVKSHRAYWLMLVQQWMRLTAFLLCIG